ncbi:hypothetical protein [Sphingobium sp. HDIP04]|uniref:hypothetical protein n=1 Tax=Sphingobium sp. HDIP04 TaxID=428994 RepID=UPI0003877422|nr:hypothetical protein [Sphingobium sp. HDIP04]EQA97278.1 hypothetical protein L286_23420 [Sphingobium sp. HDIP04]
MGLKVNKTALAIAQQPIIDTFVQPSATTEVLPIANCNFNIQGVTVANEEYTGSVHKNGDEVIGKNCTLTFNIYLRPPTGGAVPAANAFLPGRILQAAKFTENRVSAAIPAAPEAIGAGPTTTSVTLGATAAATAGLYKGLLVSLASIGTTYAQRLTAIRSYTAGKLATLMETLGAPPDGNYQIPPQLAYQRSIAETDPDPLSLSLWLDGLRFDLVNMRVSGLRINLPTSTRQQGAIPMLEVTMTGSIQGTADEATPTIPALGAVPKFRDGDLWIAGKAVGGSSIIIDLGLRTAAAPNPNKSDGSDAEELVESKTTVTADLQKYRKAQFDTLALADAQAQHAVWAQYGYGAGSVVSVNVPDARFNYRSPNVGGDFVNETGDLFVDAADRNVSIVFPF